MSLKRKIIETSQRRVESRFRPRYGVPTQDRLDELECHAMTVETFMVGLDQDVADNQDRNESELDEIKDLMEQIEKQLQDHGDKIAKLEARIQVMEDDKVDQQLKEYSRGS